MDPEQISILVVDDDESIRGLLSSYIGSAGYHVAVADDGQRALEMLSVECFDLVLLDYKMPGLDGAEVLASIRTTYSPSKTAVIMCTSIKDAGSVSHCINLGANDYLAKPINEKILRSRIWRSLMNQRVDRKRDELSADLDDNPANILVVDDSEMSSELIEARINAAGHNAIVAKNGAIALQLMAENRIDAVLLDIMMPDMDGYEVLGRIKANPEWRDIPVMMVSALDESEAATKCFDLNADDYITKPFKSAILKVRLNSILCTRRETIFEREKLNHLKALAKEGAR